MSTTPAGLQRFTRSMITRFKGACAFCGTATIPGQDYAAMSQGKWLAVCLPCTVSITAQVRGKVRMLQAASAGMDAAAIATIAASLPSNADLQVAMSESATEAQAYDALLKLDAALTVLATVKPAPAASPLLAGLQAVAANAKATPRDREFAGSLARQLAERGTLTERQQPHADRLVARYADGAEAAPAESVGEGLYLHTDGTVRKVYMTRNDRLGCKVLVVRANPDYDPSNPESREYNGSLEYEQGGRRIVADAVAAGTARIMTQDEAKAFGRQYSFCCNCAKYLDDDRSVAAGYGPTCAGNLGWWYPTHAEAAAILGRPTKG